MPMVQKLQEIHTENFRKAAVSVGKYQARYKKQYDARNKAKAFDLKVGDKVQLKRIRTKRAKGGKNELLWYPRNSYYTLKKIEKNY